MPYDDPDATDPMLLHGVECVTEGDEAVRDMAECFVEEALRLGLSPERILDLFTSGEYRGPALALRQLGRADVVGLIDRHVKLRGPRGLRAPVACDGDGCIHLPVLNG